MAHTHRVVKNDQARVLWDFQIQTQLVMAIQLETVVVDKHFYFKPQVLSDYVKTVSEMETDLLMIEVNVKCGIINVVFITY